VIEYEIESKFETYVLRQGIMKQYNKLVRDKIPTIIKANGSVARTRMLSNDGDYLEALKDKLVEEALEVKEGLEAEELADVMEVVQAIAKQLGVSLKDIEKLQHKKNQTNGSFKKRIFLESVD
jgi:predicted house-cleaning noncanonical NTP pyrophosphatase (MazG superfamily)